MTSPKKILRRAVLDDSGLERVRAMHPWLFRGNLRQIPHCNPGDLIAFTDRAGSVKGWGLWSDSALSMQLDQRIIGTNGKQTDLRGFFGQLT